jgi:large subunit ribosomal protein L9
MQVILRDDVARLGDAGEVVTVKDGYARNFLIPRSLAYIATKGNLRVWEDEKKIRFVRISKETEEAEKVKAYIETLSVSIEMLVGEEGRLFGSVTNRMIADLAKEQHDLDLDHRRVIVDEPIRAQGEFVVNVRLEHGVMADLKVIVVPENPPDEEETPVAAEVPAEETPEVAVEEAEATDETAETEPEEAV